MSMKPRLLVGAAMIALSATVVASFPVEQSFKLEDFKFSENGSDTQSLDFKGDTVDILELRVRGTVTVGGTAPTGPAFAGFANIIKTISVKANDRDTFVDITPLGASVVTIADDRMPMHIDDVLSDETETYEAILKIDMRQLNTAFPNITALDGRITSRVEMKLTYGDVSRLFSEPESAVLSNVSIDVHYSGTRSSLMPKDMYVRELIETSEPIDRADKRFVAVKVNQQSAASSIREVEFVKGIYLMGVRGEELFDVFDPNETIQVKIGNEAYRDFPISRLRRMQRRRFDGELPDEVLYIPLFENGDVRDSLPRTHLSGGLTVELGVLNEHAGELEVRAVVDKVRHLVV